MRTKIIIAIAIIVIGTALAHDARANHPRDDISFSISAWVNMDDATNFWILSKGTRDYPEYAFGVNANDFLSLTIHDGSMRATSTIYSATSSYIQALSSSALTNDQNTWIYLTAAYNGTATSTGMRLYKNAELVSATINASSTYVRMHNHGERAVVGGLYIDGSVFANGKIDDLRAYPYARTIEEIRLDYNAGLAAKFGGSPNKDMDRGLIAYYKMNEGQGQLAKDSSGSSISGSLGDTVTVAIDDPSWISATGTIAEKVGLDSVLNFDGTDDYVDLGTGLDQNGEITITAWINTDTVAAGVRQIIANFTGTTNDYIFEINRTAGRLSAWWGDTLIVTGNLNLVTGTWIHVAIIRSGTTSSWTATLYQNGRVDNSAVTAINPNAINTQTTIGRLGTSAVQFFDGQIDEVRIYNRALSAAEIRYLYNQGEPVGHWKLDEGSGGTAFDSSGNNNTGTLQNITTSTAWTTGKYGTAIDFDGINDFVLAPDSASLSITSDLTISAWIRTDIITSGELEIAGKSELAISSYLLGRFQDEIRLNIGSISNYKTTDSVNLAINTWYHISASYNSSAQTIDIYVNGILRPGTITGTIPSSIADGTQRFFIGAIGPNSNLFDGLIDDVRVYNYARSVEEIQADYNSGLAAHFGGSPNKNINRDLVGYWQFNEGAGQAAKDSSDSVNHGILGANGAVAIDDPSWITATGTVASNAKLAGTLKFDGTDDFVTVPNADSIDFDVGLKEAVTISAWINAETDGEGNNGNFISKNTNTYMRVDTRSGNNLTIGAGLDLTTTDAFVSIINPITINTWNHIVMTYSIGAGDEITVYINGVSRGSSTNGAGIPDADASNLLIGSNGPATFNFDGQIDEVRIYNRALSAAEIRYLYNKGGPVGHWKLDEGSGGTAYDSSGNNNTGTLQNMTTSTAWTTGKYGTALDFDGTNDFVLAPDSASLSITSDLTMSAWIRTDTISIGNIAIADKWDQTNQSYLLVQNGDEIRMYIDGPNNFKTTDSADLEINTWYHISAAYNSTARTVDIYINGILQPGTITGTIPASIGDDTGRFQIGAADAVDNFFNGLIDDVRVYNYVRSAEEIQADYNAGLSTYFR